MGAGNKLDPTAFEVADIMQTSVCPLARVMRRELKKRGIPKLKVVYSKELPAALQRTEWQTGSGKLCLCAVGGGADPCRRSHQRPDGLAGTLLRKHCIKLVRKMRSQIACKVARRSLCGIAFRKQRKEHHADITGTGTLCPPDHDAGTGRSWSGNSETQPCAGDRSRRTGQSGGVLSCRSRCGNHWHCGRRYRGAVQSPAANPTQGIPSGAEQSRFRREISPRTERTGACADVLSVYGRGTPAAGAAGL